MGRRTAVRGQGILCLVSLQLFSLPPSPPPHPFPRKHTPGGRAEGAGSPLRPRSPRTPGGRRLPSTCETPASALTGDKLEPGPFRLGGTRSVSLPPPQTSPAPALCSAATVRAAPGWIYSKEPRLWEVIHESPQCHYWEAWLGGTPIPALGCKGRLPSPSRFAVVQDHQQHSTSILSSFILL